MKRLMRLLFRRNGPNREAVAAERARMAVAAQKNLQSVQRKGDAVDRLLRETLEALKK